MDKSKEILSDITVHMKYAKYLPNKERRETWKELVNRNRAMHVKQYKHLGDEFKKEIYDAYKPVSYTHLTLRRSTLCRSRWSPYH